MEFIKVSLEDKENIKELSTLASSIVKEHYDPIVGSVQNDYMIEKFQSVSSLEEQIEHGYQYYFVRDNKDNIGFLAFYKRESELYLSKFYLSKTQRGKGLSKKMLDFVILNARKINAHAITLNVNKKNSAVYVYEKLGFYKKYEEKNDIGNGYFMDDYVYEYKL